MGGNAALSALQLRNAALGNYFFLAINKTTLRRTREKSSWGSLTPVRPRPPPNPPPTHTPAALDDKAKSLF